MSQRKEEAPEGTETTCREGLKRRGEVSGQEGCRAESSEKSRAGEGGREMLNSRDREWQRGLRGSRRTGESICYSFLGARQGNEVAGT